MSKDPIVDEARKTRHEIEAECREDPQKYYEHVLQLQEKHRNRLVRRQPKLALRFR